MWIKDGQIYTGGVSAFEALCPNVSDWTTGQPFYGTNTTA